MLRTRATGRCGRCSPYFLWDRKVGHSAIVALAAAAWLLGGAIAAPDVAHAVKCILDNGDHVSSQDGGSPGNLVCGGRASADASGTNSTNTVFGDSTAFGDDSENLAIGNLSDARGDGSQNVAVGRAIASGDNARNVAIGYGAAAQGLNGRNTAVGANAQANQTNASAFGAGARTTRNNQQMFGTGDNTYTMAGVGSDQSRSAQTGPLSVVTADADGNLAGRALEDIGIASTDRLASLQSDINGLRLRDNELAEGISIALALAQPFFHAGQTFAVNVGWGGFDGQNAFGATAAGVVSKGAFGPGSTTTLYGGVGVGATTGQVAGRAGLSFGW